MNVLGAWDNPQVQVSWEHKHGESLANGAKYVTWNTRRWIPDALLQSKQCHLLNNANTHNWKMIPSRVEYANYFEPSVHVGIIKLALFYFNHASWIINPPVILWVPIHFWQPSDNELLQLTSTYTLTGIYICTEHSRIWVQLYMCISIQCTSIVPLNSPHSSLFLSEWKCNITSATGTLDLQFPVQFRTVPLPLLVSHFWYPMPGH